MNFLKLFIIPLALVVISSCVTTDVSEQVKSKTNAGTQDTLPTAVTAVPIEMPPVQLIQPIYIPEKEPVPSQPKSNEVMDKIIKGILKPKDYSHAAVVYDYNSDWVYEIYCQPMRTSDIWLQQEEQTVEIPFIADSERWMLGAGVSYENNSPIQHIYVKPTEANIEASLIINTNRRVYHIILRSFVNQHMPKVRWQYHEKDLPQNYLQSTAQKSTYTTTSSTNNAINTVDPRFLSFNYTIKYSLFKKPRWIPTLAYDDGKKTYITFPEDALQAELPTVFENRGNVINYRVAKNVIIIDKLVESIQVKMEKYIVTITKKKGD